MGTTRNDFAAASAIVVLMLSASRSLPLDGHENSSRDNSLLVDGLTLEPRSSPPGTIYECLFVDPDLPICDVKRMLNAEKEPTIEWNSFKGHASKRSRRNVDVSSTNVVVYTIEGCLPSRLPFSMPSCEGISLDRIVDIQKFRPFAMRGVTRPPLVFPEFDYPQWLRMMTRLRNHASSKTGEGEQKHRIVPQEAYYDDSIQARTERLRNAATTKDTIPNAMAANRNVSNGSPPNRFIPDSSSRGEGSLESRSVGSAVRLGSNSFGERFEDVDDPPPRMLEEDSNESSYARNRWIEGDAKWMESVGYHGNCRRSKGKDNGFGYYSSSLRTGPGNPGGRAERSPVSSQGTVGPDPSSETRGIAGESVSHERSEKSEANSSSKAKGVTLSGRRKKKSKGLKLGQRQTDVDKNSSANGIARHVTGSRVAAVNKDSPGKIDAFAGSKATWRKSTAKETSSGKKYRNRGELPSSRGH